MRRRHEKNIFMRHSIPERRNLPTEQLPLSEEGKKLILSKKDQLHNIAHCFCSPYKRALETAMCAYLLNYCEIEVSDAKTKARKITWNQHVILNGTINPTDYFIIELEKDEVQDIRLGVSHVK